MSIADDVAWTLDGERVVAMDLKTPGAVPRVLEASAAVIWEEIALGGGLSAEELLERLCEIFETDEREIRPGLESLISDLVDLRLLTV